MTDSTRRGRSGMIAALLVLLTGGPAQAEITEDFNNPVAVSNGTQLGTCNQLTAATSGGGAVTVGGDGAAGISTPAINDAAILFSSQPLPATYKVTVELSSVAYPQTGAENGVTLLAITPTAPQPDTETNWAQRRLVAVELDWMPEFTGGSSIFVNYWSAATMYTWSGSSWSPGDDGWLPHFQGGQASFTVSIEKTATEYVISVSSAGASIVEARAPASAVGSAGRTEYFVLGDRLVDAFSGSMNVDSVTMPRPAACNDPAPTDGGTGPSWPEGGLKLDLSSNGGHTASNPAGSCDCRLAARPGSTGAGGGLMLLLLLLLLLTLAARRRRRGARWGKAQAGRTRSRVWP